jgi:alpha-ketoglutarate-dependent taurine dioxygenase
LQTQLLKEQKKKELKKELVAKHKIIRSVNGKKTIYCSPGHLIAFNKTFKNFKNLKNILFKHQTKKKFQYSLEWEKDQIAIWDNRSMLHQATAFNGNRKMHRITVQ